MSRSSAIRTALSFCAALAAVFLVYGATLRYGFVQDDFLFARPLTARQILSTFAGNWEPLGLGNAHYRPIVALTLAADYAVHKWRPPGYHATNLILVALCASAAVALLRRLGATPLAAALGGLAWISHPMSASSAAWCSQRTDSVMAFFYVLALWAALGPTFGRKQQALTVLFGALALGSKEMAVTLPLTLAVVLAIARPLDWRRRLAAGGALALLVGGFSLFWARLFPEKVRFFAPTIDRIATSVFPVYWPRGYKPYWNAPSPDLRLVVTFAAVVLVAAWLYARHRQREAQRLGALGLAWPLLTMVPIFGLDDPDSYRLGFLLAFGFTLLGASVATALRRERVVVLVAAAVGALWLVPLARESAAQWGPGGFQFQSLLRWRSEEPEWQERLTPEMRALFDREVRMYLRAGSPK